MPSEAPYGADPRPVWLRLLVWFGLVISAAISLPMLLIAAVEIGEPRGAFLLCFSLTLLVTFLAGVAREIAERRVARRPIQPRAERLGEEPALRLPRATAPTTISSWALAALGAVLVLGAVLAGVEGSWGLAVVLALAAVWLGLTAAPHRAAALAGGLWLTPTRLVDDYRGIRWELEWPDATGVDAHHPQRVLVATRPDRVPRLRRTGARGRAWKPLRAGNVLVIDTQHLIGGSALAGDLITKALTDPASRRLLGTPDSVPPTR